MKYNLTLDFMALALQHAKEGNFHRASACLIQASREDDAVDALRIIEHSNSTALKASTAKVEAAKKVKASDEFDDSILDEDLRGDESDDAEIAEEVSDVAEEVGEVAEDVEEHEAAEEAEDDTEAVAKVMASFFRYAAKASKPAKKK